MRIFLSALCLCLSGILIYLSFKLIYAYTMLNRFHDASLRFVEKLGETNQDIDHIQAILDRYQKPIDITYKIFHKIHSFMR